jgi:hypothetical protein
MISHYETGGLPQPRPNLVAGGPCNEVWSRLFSHIPMIFMSTSPLAFYQTLFVAPLAILPPDASFVTIVLHRA